MNTKKNIITIFIGILCFITIGNKAYSTTISNRLGLSEEALSEDMLIERINNMNCAIDIKITPELKKIIRQYTIKYRKSSEIILGKTTTFFPLFETVLEAEGMPDDLKYLSVVESGLRPSVKSKVGATGLWQFMKSTGKMYGLKINNTVDQRKDPNLSTKAAAKFLKDLYKQFGNWTLAIAAYNCGPGNVRKAIRKSGSKDYWVLQKYLPKETRRYIPKFIATLYLHKHYELYNLKPIAPQVSYENTLRLPVTSKISFKSLNKITGMSLEQLKVYNPAYIKNYIPAKGSNFITLPYEYMFKYLHSTDNLNKDVYYFNSNNRTNFSPNIIHIAEKIDNSLKEISQLKIRNFKIVTPKVATFPLSNTFKISSSENPAYRIRKGETFMDIAMRFNISIGDLITWNNITMASLPKSGSYIHISPQ